MLFLSTRGRDIRTRIFLKCLRVKQLWERAIQQFDLAEIKELDWNDIFLGLQGNSSQNKVC